MINVLGYENVDASNDSDANWLRSRIRISGPFSGEIDASLTTQDFEYFDRELSQVLRTLKGKATFQTDEEGLRFEVEMSPRGTAIVSGIAKADSGLGGNLQFLFETDQSYLAETKRSLAEIMNNFPVLQGRGP